MGNNFSIDKMKLTDALRKFTAQLQTSVKNSNPNEIDHPLELSLFINNAQDLLNSGNADFTQDYLNKLLGFDKSQDIQTSIKTDTKPQIAQYAEQKITSESEEKLSEQKLLDHATQYGQKIVKVLGNHVYEIELTTEVGTKIKSIITINPNDNSYTVQRGDKNYYHKLDKLGREIESNNGSQTIKNTYNENGYLTSSLELDKDGNQIHRDERKYDDMNRLISFKSYTADINAPEYSYTCEYSKDEKFMTIIQNNRDGSKIVRKYKKPNETAKRYRITEETKTKNGQSVYTKRFNYHKKEAEGYKQLFVEIETTDNSTSINHKEDKKYSLRYESSGIFN